MREELIERRNPFFVELVGFLRRTFGLHQEVAVNLYDNRPLDAFFDIVCDVVCQSLMSYYEGKYLLLSAYGVLRQMIKIGGENNVAVVLLPAQKIGQGRIADARSGGIHLLFHVVVAVAGLQKAFSVIGAVEFRLVFRCDTETLLPFLMLRAFGFRQFLFPGFHKVFPGGDAGGLRRACTEDKAKFLRVYACVCLFEIHDKSLHG